MKKDTNKIYKSWEIIKMIQENKIQNKTVIKEIKGLGVEYIYFEVPDFSFDFSMKISPKGLYRKGTYKDDIVYFKYPWGSLFLSDEDSIEWKICGIDENKIKIYPYKKEEKYLPIYEEL